MSTVVHIIPVPVGWGPEQSWEAVKRGVLLRHPLGDPRWVGIVTDERDRGFHLFEESESL